MRGPVRHAAVALALFTAAFAASLASGCSVVHAPVPSQGQDVAIRQIAGSVSKVRIAACLDSIDFSRTNPSANLATAEASLTGRLEAAGYVVTTVSSGVAGSSVPPMDTLIAEKLGTDPGLRPVLVMCHWDSIGPGNGMDDNASGVAATIEAATLVFGSSFRHTIRFILFGNEELNLSGSHEYVASLADKDLPEFFVNFESVGYTQRAPDSFAALMGQSAGDYLGAFAPDWAAGSLAVFSSAARNYAPGLKYAALSLPAEFEREPLLHQLAWSDHVWFWHRRAPGLMLTDGAWARNPYYHGYDYLYSLDLDFLVEVSRAGVAALCLAADIVE